MEIALIYFAVLALAFFLLIVRPQRRRAAAHRQFVSMLSVGDEVMTSGGLFGTIRGLRDDAVDLEVAPGTVIRVARPAIAQPVATNSAETGGAIDAGGPTEIDPPPDETGH
jgi:preprotein translocase subunit YajC